MKDYNLVVGKIYTLKSILENNKKYSCGCYCAITDKSLTYSFGDPFLLIFWRYTDPSEIIQGTEIKALYKENVINLFCYIDEKIVELV